MWSSSGDGGGPRRPYFLLCQIGDQQSEQEDRGEKSDLEQKTFNAVRFKRNSASKQGSPPTSLPQGQALARANSNTNRASFTSCLDCAAKAHKETSGGEVLRNKNLIKKRRPRTCPKGAYSQTDSQMLTWMCRPTSVIGGKADMARACHYVR